jgi:ketosteroid isomerase-like protein
MAPNGELIRRFYGAFDRRDGAAMTAYYAPHVTFSDPVFGELRGPEIGAMWRMLTARSDDLRVELVEVDTDEATASARWIARYTFPQTGRPVVNRVRSTFQLTEGLIEGQRDDFDFHRWARQALGPVGLCFGWTPMLRASVRSRAKAGLQTWTTKETHGEGHG